MIPALILRMVGGAAPAWLTKPIGILIDVAVAALVLWGVYAWIHHSGERAGGARVTAQVERQHTARVAEAHVDTATAQTVSTAIGATTAHSNILADDLVRQAIEDMHHAIATIPPAPLSAGAAIPDAPVGLLTASTNGLVDRANRAADAADAVP